MFCYLALNQKNTLPPGKIECDNHFFEPACVQFGRQGAAALSQEERTVLPGVSWPRRSTVPIKKPAALRVKLVPFLAGRLAVSQQLSARWHELCLHVFWQESPAEECLVRWKSRLSAARCPFCLQVQQRSQWGGSLAPR